MTLGELIVLVRDELDDAKAPYLWSDQELVEFAADAENEAARRARLLTDSTTPAICTINVVANVAEYSLDSRVLFIKRATLDSEKIHRASYRDLDEHLTKWAVDTGVVTHFITDLNTDKIRLYPIPKVTGTINLTVIRLPLTELNATDDKIEIKLHYQRALRHWCIYRAYLKQDSEAFNKGSAAEALALFEKEFGKKSSALDEEWIEREQAQNPYNGVF